MLKPLYVADYTVLEIAHDTVLYMGLEKNWYTVLYSIFPMQTERNNYKNMKAKCEHFGSL